METVGTRIRKLRKERGFTLQALAGDSLTKGMLSLIENDKANPSMESLSYIAKRLDVDKNELLEEVSAKELQDVLDQAEKLNRLATNEVTEEFKGIIPLIEPYLEKLPKRYESARLYELYSRCLYYTKQGDWKPFLEKAGTLYEDLSLLSKVADIHLFKLTTIFAEHRYGDALEQLLESRAALQERGAVLDPLKKLDFDYFESILYSAVGQMDKATEVMNEAIAYSREKDIYYRTNDLYRIGSYQALLEGDIETKDHYIGKLRLFADFTDDTEIISFTELVEIHYFTTFSKQFDKALEAIDQLLGTISPNLHPFFYLEKGKALYGLGRLEDALHWFSQHVSWEFLHHPYDLSMNYEKDAYMALIYEQFGDHDLAVQHASIAKNNILPMPDLPYKTFILDVYEQITGSQKEDAANV
ncbi:helix-turn-helix domain-containing protein [Planomicrobium sp. YIM 101495]|uniref:helix-turn-helix domain-containing protein n=1 Tax=Planomicrobium sp. YIM 101495 TaxID=2665160 RepID=UPI0012B8DC20|nr:helix-turn-helix transcriptional regulator [Planomicrobium sp. YIM 101495]MTD31567.1 helix-turn-helix domain-containing protein [Planomicrobium sp. YIM 101495]